MMKRRELLKLAGAGAVGSAFSTLPFPASAQSKPESIVVMTWGGLWGDAMRDNVDAAFQKATGIKVVQDRSSSPVERITKLKVSLNDQKVDLVQIHDGLVPLAIKQGVVEKLNKDSPRMGHVRNMIPQFWNDYWVPMIFSAIGVTYNTKLVKNPPTSFADLWRPEFKGRIVLPEVSHSIGTYIIPIGAMAAGKDPKDEAAGFEMLKKMADLKPVWAKDTDSIMNAFRDEEAVIGLLYKSQTYTVKGWKTPVEWVYPKEGGIPYISGTSIAKNTKNLEAAESYLNATMDPDVQPFVTKVFNYPGTNKDMLSRLPSDLQERAQFTQEQLNRLVTLDHEFMSDKRAEWTQRWNRVVAGG
ncbi:MAG TPA: extracellular solute-binding protein [Alphaproteobacteria bacterium]|nr:extracellular solute-binding protein [Alphaproteobacteria bacterium]